MGLSTIARTHLNHSALFRRADRQTIRPHGFLWHSEKMVPQFYLITPLIDDTAAFQPQLEAVIASGVFNVVLLRINAANETEFKRKAGELKTPLVTAGIAVLIDAPEEPRLVARLQLDGAHTQSPPALSACIEALKPDRIVGAGSLRSRHDAMEAGERDIDYVMFGEPRADGFTPPLAQTIERAAWWADIFNIPCVAYAPDITAIAPLAATGADFLALGPWLFDAEDPAAIAAEARRIGKANAKPDLPPG